MKIENKVAVITGGASGIGKAVSIDLLERGAFVVFIDINGKSGVELEKQWKIQYGKDRVVFLRCDVTNSTELECCFRETKRIFGGIDIVFNNAGVTDPPFLHNNTQSWKRVLDINLMSVIDCTRIAILYMRDNDDEKTKKEGGDGIIINVASMAGLIPLPISPVYSASKYGVVGFTNALSISINNPQLLQVLSGSKMQGEKLRTIRLNTLCPTFIDTPMVGNNTTENSLFREIVAREGGPLPARLVVDGVIQLIEDDQLHGAVMRITHQKGIDFLPKESASIKKKSKL